MTRKINKTFTFSGHGIHSGEKCSVTVSPGESAGIYIQNEEGKKTKVDVSKVESTMYATSLSVGSGTVSTVEHLLSALYGLHVQDALVTVKGTEIPILEGSSRKYAEAILQNSELEDKELKIWKFVEPLSFEYGESVYYIVPFDSLELNVSIEYPDLGMYQSAYFHDKDSDYLNDISPAQTFSLASDLERMLEGGFVKGASIQNGLVINDIGLDQKAIKAFKQKFNIEGEAQLVELPLAGNEQARHKLLDFLGDLSLLGIWIKGRVFAKRPGHEANIAFVNFLKAYITKNKKLVGKPIYDPTADPLYDIEGIKELIPHRYPFLLVDKIIELSENHVVGIKNVTQNEPFFQGHFPGNPVFPGVLQLEALAQTGGILALNTVPDPQNYNTYFLKIDNVKFKNLVVPGDTMILKLELISPIRRGIFHMRAIVYVGNKIASESELTAQIIKKS